MPIPGEHKTVQARILKHPLIKAKIRVHDLGLPALEHAQMGRKNPNRGMGRFCFSRCLSWVGGAGAWDSC